MTISVNGYDHQNYPQRNLKANNPNFGMAQISARVAKKTSKDASKFGGKARKILQKLGKIVLTTGKCSDIMLKSHNGSVCAKRRSIGKKLPLFSI